MKKREIKPVIEGLKKIQLVKIENKAVNTALFKSFMKLLGEQKKYESDQEDLRTVFLSAYKEEQSLVLKLQSDFQMETDAAKRKAIYEALNEHEDFRKASETLSEKMEELGRQEVENLEPLDQEKFCEAYMKQGCDLTVIEAIFPLFNN